MTNFCVRVLTFVFFTVGFVINPSVLQAEMAVPKTVSKLRYGLFNRESHHVEQPLEEKEPMIIWTRMRESFNLIYPENHPWIKTYIKRIEHSSYYLHELGKNAEPYLYYITEMVEEHGLPLEIALLPMVESTFNPYATSRSGATGLWQIMPLTGKRLGLTEDWWLEGRRDIVSSTNAALRHLKYLHRHFDGDWLLALAAYNSGENKVKRAIKRNQAKGKKTDFFSLDLPKETRDYVPKLLALVSVIKHPQKFNVVLPTIPNKPKLASVELDHQIELSKAAELANVSMAQLKQLNPGLKRFATHPDGEYHLMIPHHKAKEFKINLRKVGDFSVNYYRYKVQPGDNLSTIALHYDTSVRAIKQLNQLKNDNLRVGLYILIPKGIRNLDLSANDISMPVELVNDKLIHQVKAGDTLWKISKQYKVSIKDIASLNNMNANATLHPGQTLTIQA